VSHYYLINSKGISKKIRAAMKKFTYTLLDHKIVSTGVAMEWGISMNPVGKKHR